MNKSTLFDNPMIESARKAMSKKDLDRYQKLGESMYKDINFETSSVNNLPQPMINAAIYVESMIKSGMHPSLLDENDKNAMLEVYGEEWYKKYGYVKGDLTDIITLKLD
jgi:hypothetical protein